MVRALPREGGTMTGGELLGKGAGDIAIAGKSNLIGVRQWASRITNETIFE